MARRFEFTGQSPTQDNKQLPFDFLGQGGSMAANPFSFGFQRSNTGYRRPTAYMPNPGAGLAAQGMGAMGDLGNTLGQGFGMANAINASNRAAQYGPEAAMRMNEMDNATMLQLRQNPEMGGAGGPLSTLFGGQAGIEQSQIMSDLQRYLGGIGQQGETERQGTFGEQARLTDRLAQMQHGANLQQGGSFDQRAGLEGILAQLGIAGGLQQSGDFGQQSQLAQQLSGMEAQRGLLSGGTFDQNAQLQGGLAALQENARNARVGTIGNVMQNIFSSLPQVGFPSSGPGGGGGPPPLPPPPTGFTGLNPDGSVFQQASLNVGQPGFGNMGPENTPGSPHFRPPQPRPPMPPVPGIPSMDNPWGGGGQQDASWLDRFTQPIGGQSPYSDLAAQLRQGGNRNPFTGMAPQSPLADTQRRMGSNPTGQPARPATNFMGPQQQPGAMRPGMRPTAFMPARMAAMPGVAGQARDLMSLLRQG